MLLWRLGAVLLVRHPFHPCDWVAVERFLNRDMTHGCCGGRAMPVLLAGFERHDVARTDLLDGSVPTLHAAKARGDDQRLTERMRMPGRARAGLEGDVIAGDARGTDGRKQGIYTDRAGEILGRSPGRRLGSRLSNLHRMPPQRAGLAGTQAAHCPPARALRRTAPIRMTKDERARMTALNRKVAR